MITDEQLIERLSRSMDAATADVFPPSDLVDGVKPSRGLGVRLPSGGGVAAVCATAIALGVAVVAITSLGRGPAPTTRPAAPRTHPAPPASSLAALRSELAVLRRAQRPADRIPGAAIAFEESQQCSNCLNVATLIPGDTRLLATVQARAVSGPGRTPERVYLVLGKVPRKWGTGRFSGWRQRRPAIEGLHLSLFGLSSERSRQPDELLNYTTGPMPAAPLSPRDVLIASLATIGVVPDGVTRVKWELANPGQRRPATVYPRIHGNVAIAPWTPAPRSTDLLNEQWLVGATWYGPDGRVIASFTGDLARIGQG